MSSSVTTNGHVIIAADNDGIDSASVRVVLEAKLELEKQGAIVNIVSPPTQGDFNDILQQHAGNDIVGKAEVSKLFTPIINRLTAKTLDEYFSHMVIPEHQAELIDKDIRHIRKYHVPEDHILAEFKHSQECGMAELAKSVERVAIAESTVHGSARLIIDELKMLNSNVNIDKLVGCITMLESNEHEQYLAKSRDDLLGKYLDVNINKFLEEKRKAGNVNEVLEVVTKEQQFLSEAFNKLQQPVYKYQVKNIIALFAGKVIDEKPDLLKEVKNKIEQAMDKKVMYKTEIINLLTKQLDMSYVLKEVEIQCELHEVKSNLEKLEQGKQQAKSCPEILKIYEQEEKFLREAEDNFKYAKYSNVLQEPIKQAKLQHQDNVISQLHGIIEKTLSKGVKMENKIVAELRITPNLAASYENLDRDYEAHHISNNLAILTKNKEQAKAPEGILQVVKQQQEFLSNLHGNLQYDYQPSLLKAVEQAYAQHQNNVMDDLHKATMHVISNKIMPEQELIKVLKATENPHMTEQELRRACEDHHIAYINKNLHQLDSSEHLQIGNKTFSCKAEYIRHEIKNPAHDFACTPRIMKIMQKYERKLELQMRKEMHYPTISM